MSTTYTLCRGKFYKKWDFDLRVRSSRPKMESNTKSITTQFNLTHLFYSPVMRKNKFKNSYIHILEPETLSRESRVTESAQEIVNKPLIIPLFQNF